MNDERKVNDERRYLIIESEVQTEHTEVRILDLGGQPYFAGMNAMEAFKKADSSEAELVDTHGAHSKEFSCNVRLVTAREAEDWEPPNGKHASSGWPDQGFCVTPGESLEF